MSYCQVDDVLDAIGADITRVVELSRFTNDADATTLINDFISKATREIQRHINIPITIHCECHQVDEDIVNYQTRVYLGNADESYCEYDELIDTFDVQGLVQDVLRVYVGGVRRKTTDDTYPWTWVHTAVADYISFTGTQPLVDGDSVLITYTYDPYAITVPVNIEEATACLAGIKLLDMLRGTRQTDTDFDLQSESGVTDPTKDKLTVSRSQLKQRYLAALASEGYGFDFIPIRG